MTIRLARGAVLALMLSATLARPAPAQAAPYQFELLGERPRGATYVDSLRALPALNDRGTAAFMVHAGTGPGVEALYTGTPGDVRLVETPGALVRGGVSINNPGRIGFIGNALDGFHRLYAVTAGGPVVTIGGGNFDIEASGHFETAISDSGAVMALSDQPQHFPSSVIIGDGTSPAREVFRTPPLAGGNGGAIVLTAPRMSAGGDWTAHDFEFDGPGYAAVLSSRGSVSTVTQQLTKIGSSDVAGDGVVIFQGTPFAGYPGMPLGTRRALFTFGTDRLRVVPGSEALPEGTVAMNDLGVIALLEGQLQGSGTRLWLLRDGAVDTVLSAGDPLLGSAVSTIGFDPKGFNNADQFALLVALADGRDVYVLASPVPEPGAMSLFALAGALMLRRCPPGRTCGPRGGA